MSSSVADIADLASENKSLKARIADLESQLLMLRTHRTLAQGVSGETLISSIVKGKVTAYAAHHDVETNEGIRLEVKASARSFPSRGYESARWQWAKLFGEGGRKQFDYIILLGEVDDRYRTAYRDPQSPYVIFLVPHADLMALSSAGQRDAYRAIKLNTNPAGSSRTSDAHRALWERYQTTVDELQQKFGIL